MDPDLVFPPGFQVDVHEGIAAAGTDRSIVGNGLLGVPARRAGVHEMGGGLPQEGFYIALFRVGHALHQGPVAPAAHPLVPVGLEGPLGLLVFGKKDHAGGVPVQAVDHKDPAALGPLGHVVGEDVVGGAHLLLVVGDGDLNGHVAVAAKRRGLVDAVFGHD